MNWQPIDTAPKDGTWLLLRGRNALGYKMIPVVASWRSGEAGDPAWRDSASLRDVGFLALDEGADWAILPSDASN